ncbi:MAG TPA: glycoside hydrolase family 9 protein [Streptosporangiaceae bacterium]
MKLRPSGVTSVLAASVLALASLAAALGPAPAALATSGGRADGAAATAACQAPASGTAAPASGAPGSPPAAVIRVDQIGYPAGRGLERAAVMIHRSRSAPAWVLVSRRGCRIVARGTTGRDLGPWSHAYPAVRAIRFGTAHLAGTYRFALAGRLMAVSPWFRIGPASTLYTRALANSLEFYQNERDGPHFIRSALRTAPGHLNDLHAMTYRAPRVNGNGNFKGSLRPYATGLRINATGGWFDAGDYLKFTETTSYTVAMMLQGMATFPGKLGNFGREAAFGLDFLQRMWNERTRTLYLQVGTGEANSRYFGDHDIWRLPQADDHYHGTDPRYQYIRHPPVFRAGKPGARISPNLAGRLAADFALCYRVYRALHPAYAARCLRSAETVYALAGTHWHGKLQTVLPWDFYPETSWRDDMVLGATELALALRSGAGSGAGAGLPSGLPVRSAGYYLAGAARWAKQWMASPASGQDTLNLYDVSALGDYELYRAMAAPHPRLAVSRAGLLANLRGQLGHATTVAAGDPFGFGFAWDQWDTTAHGLGLAVMAGEYDRLTGGLAYAAWGQRQLDDVLGTNAWGVSLIVGDGTVFPDCMQHQVTNLAGSHDGQPPILAGAVVEGPNSFAAVGSVPNMRPCSQNAPGGVPYSVFRGHKAVFRDNVQSYSTVEPAIDLTALSPLAFAWQSGGRARY